MKMEFDINAKEIKDSINECTGLVFTDIQVEDILKSNLLVACEISTWGLDTEAKSKIVNLACESIGVCKDWPSYGSTPEYEAEFYKDLATAAFEHDVIYITSEQGVENES